MSSHSTGGCSSTVAIALCSRGHLSVPARNAWRASACAVGRCRGSKRRQSRTNCACGTEVLLNGSGGSARRARSARMWSLTDCAAVSRAVAAADASDSARFSTSARHAKRAQNQAKARARGRERKVKTCWKVEFEVLARQHFHRAYAQAPNVHLPPDSRRPRSGSPR
eukprot:257379-Rhodomonas_salina.1